MATTTRTPVGELLRRWRVHRRLSQLDLAVEAGVSTRHLSFVETGRARPSRELVLLLAEHLDVPLRERNGLLLAAGFAPGFGESSLDDPQLASATDAVRRMLELHQPFPAVAVDRHWDVVMANDAATSLLALVSPDALGPPVNVYRLSLHPGGLAGSSPNLDEWVGPLVRQLRRQIVLTGDRDLEHLHHEVCAYPHVAALLERHSMPFDGAPTVLIPLRLTTDAGELSLFTTLTTFGTPVDVTLDELVVELFWPADQATAAVLAG